MKTVAWPGRADRPRLAGGSRLERSNPTRASARWRRRGIRHDRCTTRRFRQPERQQRHAGQSWWNRIAVEPRRGPELGRAVRHREGSAKGDNIKSSGAHMRPKAAKAAARVRAPA